MKDLGNFTTEQLTDLLCVSKDEIKKELAKREKIQKTKLAIRVGDCYLDRPSAQLLRIEEIHNTTVVYEVTSIYDAKQRVTLKPMHWCNFLEIERIGTNVYNALISQVNDYLSNPEELNDERKTEYKQTMDRLLSIV